MLAPVVSKRYAEALFAAAQDARLVTEVESDLMALATGVREPAVAAALRNPTLDAKTQKATVLGAVDARLRTNLVRNVIALAIDRRRAEMLFSLADAYHRLALESRGEAEGVVESAKALSEAEMRDIEATLSKATGKRVRLQAHVRPELLGGLRATVGSLRYDSTAKTRLAELREKLLSARIEG